MEFGGLSAPTAQHSWRKIFGRVGIDSNFSTEQWKVKLKCNFYTHTDGFNSISGLDRQVGNHLYILSSSLYYFSLRWCDAAICCQSVPRHVHPEGILSSPWWMRWQDYEAVEERGRREEGMEGAVEDLLVQNVNTTCISTSCCRSKLLCSCNH